MHEKSRHSSKDKPARCPDCGSEKVVEILRGYPTPDAMAEAEKGRVVLGGCIVTGDDPLWQCTECEVQIYSEGR